MGRKRKRKNKVQKQQVSPQTAQKSISYPLGFNWRGGVGGRNNDIVSGKPGAAAAYTLVHEVRASINAIIRTLNGFEWAITRYPDGIRRDGEELARSNDIAIRHDFQSAARYFQDDNGFTLIEVIAWCWLLYGEVYIEKLQNAYGFERGFDWLNPLGVQVDYNRYIKSFRYGWNNQYVTIQPNEVAYWHNLNPQCDFIGLPIIDALLTKININRNLDRYLRAFFINDANPGTVASPKDKNNIFGPTEMENLRRDLRNNQGVDNAFNFNILPMPYDVTVLPIPDLGKNVELDKHTSQAVYDTFGVDKAILGNTTGSPYKDQREWFARATVIPLARQMERFINIQLLPFLAYGQNAVFEFDTTEFDERTEQQLQQAQLIDTQINGTLIDLYTAAQLQGIAADERLRGLYYVGGVPVPVEQLPEYWRNQLIAAPSVYNVENVTGKPLPQPVEPTQVIPTEEGGVSVVEPQPIDDSADADEDTAQTFAKSDNGCTCHGDNCIHHLEWDELEYSLKIQDELKAWYNFERNRRGGKSKSNRDFVFRATPIWMQFAVIDNLSEHTPDDTRIYKCFDFNALSDLSHVKSIAAYQRGLRATARGVWSGVIGVEQAESNIKRLIEVQFRDAFNTGVERGGLTFGDLTDDQQAKMGELIAEEQSHVADLIGYIDERSRANGGKLAAIQAHVDRWTARFANVEETGFTVASWTKRLKWTYNPAKENCRDCTRLNGKVKTGKQWFQYGVAPRSSLLECFGIFCGCALEPTDEPISRGRLPRLVGSR